jgi:hypothetical protein
MNLQVSRSDFLSNCARNITALVCAIALLPGDVSLMAAPPPQDNANANANAAPESAKLPADQLDSLVAPIALYPDPLLSQTLVASTYPLEVIQLQQWLEKNKGLKDKALADAVAKQPWDPSIQALAALPDVVKLLSENVKWTTDLGNAFLAQQKDVMDAVQRMRKKAQDSGNLKSSEQQKVETKVVENKQVIVVQQSNPEVIYVPSYNPTVVYGAPPYPYPPVTYPPPGYYAAGMAISFGVGMMMGAAWGGGWGYGAHWGGNNDIVINNNNNFVANSNRQNVNNINRSTNRANGTWQHNPQHRGGAPYSDRATARQYGGTTRGDSLSNRQANARQNQAQRNRQQAGVNNRSAGNGRVEQASARDRNSGGRQQAGVSDRSAGGRDAGSRGGGGDRVGDRSVSGGAGSRDSGALGGGGDFNGRSARDSSARGSSSMGQSRSGGGGGGRRSGGGGGGRRR